METALDFQPEILLVSLRGHLPFLWHTGYLKGGAFILLAIPLT